MGLKSGGGGDGSGRGGVIGRGSCGVWGYGGG